MNKYEFADRMLCITDKFTVQGLYCIHRLIKQEEKEKGLKWKFNAQEVVDTYTEYRTTEEIPPETEVVKFPYGYIKIGEVIQDSGYNTIDNIL